MDLSGRKPSCEPSKTDCCSRLLECLGQAKAKRIADRIAAYTGRELSSDIVPMEPIKGELVNFGQFSDRSNVTEARMGIAFGSG